jgi:hypothetical protein
MLIYLIILLISLLKNCHYNKETDYYCTGSEAQLECPQDKRIIIMGTFGRYSPSQCVNQDSVDFLSNGSPPLDHCIGINRNDEFLNSYCNGLSSCKAFIQQKKHQVGFDGTTCDFVSNMQKIFYKCVPNKIESELKAFDICGPETIANIENGYIHSPTYPNYYGNFRNCMISILVPKGHTLNIFVLTKSLEGLSMFSQQPKDYFVIDNEIEQYGYSDRPYLVYSGAEREKINIKFTSDPFTLKILSEPKGFLLYFEINAPLTTTTTTASTSTTSTSNVTVTFSKLAHGDSISQKMKKEIDKPEESMIKLKNYKKINIIKNKFYID